MQYFLFCSGEPYETGSVITDKEMGAWKYCPGSQSQGGVGGLPVINSLSFNTDLLMILESLFVYRGHWSDTGEVKVSLFQCVFSSCSCGSGLACGSESTHDYIIVLGWVNLVNVFAILWAGDTFQTGLNTSFG